MALSDNLVAYYPLDETSGNALDAHGSNDLTDTNTVGSATGKVGNARDFELDTNEYFTIDHASQSGLSFGNEDFTIAFWIQAETLPGGFTARRVMGKRDGSNNGYAITCINDTSTIHFRLELGTFDPTVNSSGITTSTWYFVVVYHDSVSNEIGISINAGTPVTASHSGGVATNSVAFQIGTWNSSTASWDGLIDEVGIWGRVLTSDERTELYNSGSGRDYAYITGGGGGASVTVHNLLANPSANPYWTLSP